MRLSLLVIAGMALAGATAGWGQVYVSPSNFGCSDHGYGSSWGHGSWGWSGGHGYARFAPLPIDSFGNRSPSGGHRSYRYLYGRDGLASHRPRRHSTRSSGVDAQGYTETTDYYYDARDELHYADSASRGLVYETYGDGGTYRTSWPGVVEVDSPPLILGDTPFLYGGHPSWRGSWGQGYVISQRGR